MDLTAYIRDIPDFPKPGILFKDITPLLADPVAFQHAIDLLADHYRRPADRRHRRRRGRAASCSPPRWPCSCSKPLVPLRKPGKLPYRTYTPQVRSRVRQRRAAHAHRRHQARATACCWSTTCSRPAAPCRPAAS